MGKSKKTRWRTFEISGSQDETQTNGDVKVNGTDSDSHAPVASQKYSQILGDHHSNSSTQPFGKNSSSHHIYKSRAYNNKENFYNQRSGGRGGSVQRSWQRGGNYRSSIVNGRDKRPDENEKAGSNDAKVDSTAEPIKFNEDEYTRITTPRQDVLFKKGYLSRMNNKTATNLSATVNSTESTAASSTITTSDPDSSVSTLSPATTPSMDYGQVDSMDYAPMYYPGYYDENGMLVIPMYNGYNYYPPNGSTATSPVFLMPYPCQYDPFFMTPTGLQSTEGDDNAEDKTESDGAKENNQNAENQNGARSTSSSEDGASSNHDDEKKEEKKIDNQENGDDKADENASNETGNADQKPSFPNYPNELNGYMYPAYPNGYYNNFYYNNYYNGAPSSRPPPKMRRRKRFLNSRNSHQQPRSADTTTDYSDDENTTYTKRFNPRYPNGWMHHSGYNHYNGKFHRVNVDQNANQTSNEFHLNVDVQEFYPRVQMPETKVNCDEPSNDLQRRDIAPLSKSKVDPPKAVAKASHPAKPSATRVTKREIIEGIKSMEQQNIDLMATKQKPVTNASQDDEWNVIKKGKKVKVVRDIKIDVSSSDIREVKKDKVEEIKIEQPIVEEAASIPEPVKKPVQAPTKLKKSKSKNKKKKSHLTLKQDGFEIIEPEFNKSSISNEVADEEISPDLSEDEATVESEEIPPEVTVSEPQVPENVVLNEFEAIIESVEVEPEVVKEVEEEIAQMPEKSPEVVDLPQPIVKSTDDDDAVIDISDEDICCKTSMPLEFEVVEKAERVLEPKIQACTQVKAPEVQVKAPEIQVKAQEVQVKVEVQAPTQTKTKKEPEVQVHTPAALNKKPELKLDPFQDMDYFNDRTNIAALERDLMENLRMLDDEIDLKSPIINPLHDFPITSAVRKWLQAKQNESFDSLFHVQNLKKLSELYDDDEEDETESDISEKEMKSETDSDYASDFHAKANGGSPTCSTHAKGSSKCNKLLLAKESFCALM